MNKERGMTNVKRLYRSRRESMVAGVAGGLGVYFSTDPVLVRLIFVAVGILTGLVPGLLAYAVAWIIMPLESAPITVHHAPASEAHDAEVAQ
jgi:phage shock protein C